MLSSISLYAGHSVSPLGRACHFLFSAVKKLKGHYSVVHDDVFFPCSITHTPFVSCTLIAKSCCCAFSDSFLTELDLGVQDLEHLNERGAHLTAQPLFTQLAQYLWQD